LPDKGASRTLSTERKLYNNDPDKDGCHKEQRTVAAWEKIDVLSGFWWVEFSRMSASVQRALYVSTNSRRVSAYTAVSV
jgi:hypothetical protein